MLAYPFEKVPGFLCEVGWEVQFAFKNFVNGFFPVLSCKRGLERQKNTKIKKTLLLELILLVNQYYHYFTFWPVFKAGLLF